MHGQMGCEKPLFAPNLSVYPLRLRSSYCTCCKPATIHIALAVARPETLGSRRTLVLGGLKGCPRSRALAMSSCYALVVLMLLLRSHVHALLLCLLCCCHALLHLQAQVIIITASHILPRWIWAIVSLMNCQDICRSGAHRLAGNLG